jgi:DNA mismatch repair protein MutS
MVKKEKNMNMIAQYFVELEKYYKKYGEKVLLLWHCGGFYEVYTLRNPETNTFDISKFDDYIAITKMNRAKRGNYIMHENIKKEVWMAGFNHDENLLDKWVKVLTDNGYTIPVWEEFDIAGKKEKGRQEMHIYSPGTNFTNDSKTISNNVACYFIEKYEKNTIIKENNISCGCATIDIFTGKSVLFQYKKKQKLIHNPNIFNELERFNSIYSPKEIIIIHNYENQNNIKEIIDSADLQTKHVHIISILDDDDESSVYAKNCMEQSYQKKIIEKYFQGIEYDTFIETTRLAYNFYAFKSFCYLLNFLHEHNSQLTNKINYPYFENTSSNLMLGNHSLKQLNVIETYNSNGAFSSVEKMMNKCLTSMGKRSLKYRILHPNTDIEYLKEEYNIIEHIVKNINEYKNIRNELTNIKDIERLYRKIVCQKVLPCDLFVFFENLKIIKKVHNKIKEDETMNNYIKLRTKINIIESCDKLIRFLNTNINMDICCKIYNNKFEENFFNKGVNDVLDETQDDKNNSELKLYAFTKYLSSLIGINERNKPNNNFIKIHQTLKSGIQLHTTKRRASFLMNNLKNQETHTFSFSVQNKSKNITFKKTDITEGRKTNDKLELKGYIVTDLCKDVMSYTESLSVVLKNVYRIFVEELMEYKVEMNNLVEYVSLVDIILTNSTIAYKNNYTKPIIKSKKKKSYIKAKDVRHPLIENILTNEIYTPNDIDIGTKTNGILVYGTNGAGKSSYNRSIGISVIMAQAGLFVPASYFEYKPYTKIFTRILGNDNIFKSMSTFQVEMCEIANILEYADENSLILGDELCSGTEHRSAHSIFISALQYFEKVKASYVLATHFHEILQTSEFKNIKKLIVKHMGVAYDEVNDTLIYTRKLENGPGDSIYGLEVCKALHLPKEFLDNANKIRKKYDKNIGILHKKKSRYNTKKLKDKCEMPNCNNNGDDIHHLKPQELASVNGYIKNIHKNHMGNIVNICKTCHNKVTKNNIIHKKTKTIDGRYVLIEQPT